MINKLNINDINRVNELGKELNANFIKLFHIENLNNNEIIYTYKIENNVLGFIHIFDNIDNVEILNIVVDKKYRKQHIGSKLLDYIINKYHKNIILEVNSSNKAAISLYQKNNFKEINIRKKYYGTDDAIIMERKTMKDIYILGIESSCDETSMSIIKNGHENISTTILTQMDTHALFGGVVPEIASRMHTENITMVLEDVFSKTNLTMNDIDAVAVTYAPGLLGSLLVGIEAAKVISLVYKKPLIKVHHIAGHIYANNLVNQMQFPLLALVVSGGHTELVLMEDDYKFKVIAKTLDDAIGEVYDKVARVLDLPYPGGPNIEKYAAQGKNTYKLPIPMNNNELNFSFSGLKSAVINLAHNEKQRGNEIRKYDLACSFQTVAIDELVRKTRQAIEETNTKRLIIAGGVSANKYLREKFEELTKEYNVELTIPQLKYCTDNAAMIACAAYPLYLKKEFTDFSLNGESTCDLF